MSFWCCNVQLCVSEVSRYLVPSVCLVTDSDLGIQLHKNNTDHIQWTPVHSSITEVLLGTGIQIIQVPFLPASLSTKQSWNMVLGRK